MMENWYQTGMAGKKPAIPAEGITWQTLPILNHRIYEKYRGTDLEKSISLFKESHNKIMDIIEKHTDDELFTKKKYQMDRHNFIGRIPDFSNIKPLRLGLKNNKTIKENGVIMKYGNTTYNIRYTLRRSSALGHTKTQLVT
ncbi:hypothetical protein AGMMS50229_14150 [Campylobacterota bacterium]|nr:hypothetical protein AGMMS50229_14150 [Campylobacterota bacterium]